MLKFSVERVEPRCMASVTAPVSVDGANVTFRQAKASGIFAAYKSMSVELNGGSLRLFEGDQDPVRGTNAYTPATRTRPAALYISGPIILNDPEFSVKTTLQFDSFKDGVYTGHYAMRVVLGPDKVAGDTENGTFTMALRGGSYHAEGIAFDDTNVNGKKDRGEAGVAGATVWADLDNDGTWDRNEPRAITLRDGYYRVSRIPAAWSTTLRIALPGAWKMLDTKAAAVTLPNKSGGVMENVNFTAGVDTWLRGKIIKDVNADGLATAADRYWADPGTVWADTNYNGRLDAGEPQASTVGGRYALHANIPAGTAIRYQSDLVTTVGPKKGYYLFLTNVVHSNKVDFLVR